MTDYSATDQANFSPSLSLVMPVYNEKELVQQTSEKIVSFMTAHSIDHELIIIESGSFDGTAELCLDLEKKHNSIRVIQESERNGFGAALKLGYKAATKNYVSLVTADLPFPLEKVCEAIPLLRKYDCVLSYRSVDNRGVFRGMQSFLYNHLAKLCLGLRQSSVNSAFKIYPAYFLQAIDIKSNDWTLDAEVLYWANKHGLKYTEIPVPLIDRELGSSKISIMTSINTFASLIRLSIRLRAGNRRARA